MTEREFTDQFQGGDAVLRALHAVACWMILHEQTTFNFVLPGHFVSVYKKDALLQQDGNIVFCDKTGEESE